MWGFGFFILLFFLSSQLVISSTKGFLVLFNLWVGGGKGEFEGQLEQ